MTISSQTLKEQAAALGFSRCGLAPARPVDEARQAETARWIAEGCHGEMHYLARHLDLRADPRLLVEGAQTVVSLAVNYNPGPTLPAGGRLRLARYAYSADYHEVVKDMLRRLMAALGLGEGADGRCFVDTAPVDEKYWAWQCGLGWRGRNSQLIIPGLGSYFFLGELILTHPADAYDRPCADRCGACRACLDACPTHALRGDGTMDARRCLSYLTIEQRGDIPPEAARHLSPCIYGCDRCAEACPWNRRFATPTRVGALQPRPSLLAMSDEAWRALTPDRYRALFTHSAVKRAKYDGLMRNIRAATAAADTPTTNAVTPSFDTD